MPSPDWKWLDEMQAHTYSQGTTIEFDLCKKLRTAWERTEQLEEQIERYFVALSQISEAPCVPQTVDELRSIAKQALAGE